MIDDDEGDDTNTTHKTNDPQGLTFLLILLMF